MMPIKLFVYRLRVNQYGLVSIKYIQDGYIKYAVFEKKYLDIKNGYNNSFNLGKRQYQSHTLDKQKDEIMNVSCQDISSSAANFGRKNSKYYIQSCQSLQFHREILGKYPVNIYSLTFFSVYLMYEISN